MRDSLERTVQGAVAELKTEVALLKVGMANIQHLLNDVKSEQEAIRRDFREMDDKREESGKVFSRWMIAFVTAALTVAVTSLFALARSAS